MAKDELGMQSDSNPMDAELADFSDLTKAPADVQQVFTDIDTSISDGNFGQDEANQAVLEIRDSFISEQGASTSDAQVMAEKVVAEKLQQTGSSELANQFRNGDLPNASDKDKNNGGWNS